MLRRHFVLGTVARTADNSAVVIVMIEATTAVFHVGGRTNVTD